MERILLLVDDDRDRGLLEHWLSTRYQVIVLPAGQSPDTLFDLCILDIVALTRLEGWVTVQRASQERAMPPFLLITSRQGIQRISQRIWQMIDELIVSPLDPLELQARIARLLHTRHLSLELERSYDTQVRILKAIESTSDAISIADIDGTALYHNQAFYDLYNYTVNELNVRGIPETLFVQPEVADNIFRTVRRGASWSGEVVLKRKGGQVMPTLLRADCIEDESGRRIGLVTMYTDMNRIRTMEATERPQRILAEALRDIVSAVNSTLDLDEVLELILEYVGRVVPHDAANIMLVEGSEAYIANSVPDMREEALACRFSIEQNAVLAHMATTGQPVLLLEVQDPGVIACTGMDWAQAYLGAPIRIRDECVGFIHMGSTTAHFFAGAHAQRLQTFGQLVGTAIENARLYARAEELARLKERQRIARDLHDAVSQTLFSASGVAEALPRLWQRDPEKVWPRLQQLQQLTRGALAEMRTLLVELRPTALLETSLSDLLKQLAEGVMGRSRIVVSVDIHHDARIALPPNVHEALYYIAQEALNNIVKHARASQASIELARQEDGLLLQISDNGRGFEPETVSTHSMGLKIMRERADSIQALWELETCSGQGTQVKVIWPNGQEGR